MSKYLIKLGRRGESKVLNLIPEEASALRYIISEYYAGSDDSGYIIKIPYSKIEDIKKFIKNDNIEEGVIRFLLCNASQLPEEISLGAYDDLVKHYVELIKNS